MRPLYDFLCGLLLLSFSFLAQDAFSQNTFASPEFSETIIQSAPGEKLAFTLSGLPDPGTFADSNGSLDIQINWQIGDDCDAGESFSETVKITSTTQYIETNYMLDKDDDRKKIRILLSYVEPTGKEQMPAKGFIATMNECITLDIVIN